ncbi:unnamed protein product [Darwinula stevensoni]|nr:unnamed protein product [Darwinula stevensoni]CAG0908463.1 unnamed protein product [Darwinula stevensoni]
MILSDSASELTAMEKPFLSFYDKQVDSTYFLARIEPRITLVLIFKYKHSEKEGVIVNFLTEMSLQLRCNRVLATLKNG